MTPHTSAPLTFERRTYAAFSKRLHDECVRDRIPVNGALEVTWRCNLRCVHCSVNHRADDRQEALRELSFDEYTHLFDELAEAGCLWLLFTGGEPFVRPDFLDIYLEAKRHGFLVTLFTNGTMITPRIADALADCPPFQVEISLYGNIQSTYESVTRVPGSHDKCLRGINLLRERGIPLELKTVAIRENKHEIADLQAFAESLGLNFRFDAAITPRLDCSLAPLGVRLTPEEIVELDLADENRAQEWHRLYNRFCQPVKDVRTTSIYECGAGIVSFSVDPGGGLHLCSLSMQNSYDLKSGSFPEGWRALAGFRARKSTRETKCTACRMKVMCGMCPANAELEAGEAEEPVEFLCRTCHLRASKLGMPIDPHGDCEHCRDIGPPKLSCEAQHKRT